jgi:signal transduction histidine kinase
MKEQPFINKIIFLKFILCVFSIVLIAVAILLSGTDFQFAILFLIPVAVYSIQKDVKLYHILILSVFATIVWIETYCAVTLSVFNLEVLFHATLRFFIYFFVSYLLFRLVKQRIELMIKNKELIDINNEKNSILGIAAHDIRNSASAIYSFSDMLLENLKSKENLNDEKEISTIIYNASDNLLRLVTDLLDISKIDSGKINLDKSPNDYSAFIENRVNLYKIIARKKNINIVLQQIPGLKNIFFDPVYLSEVIDNLITNAIKYSNRDSEIIVTVRVIDNNRLRTEVKDSGIGINSTELDQLFKPFSKTSGKPTSGEASSGLGLAIAQKVINLHGGEIGVESRINEGSTFFYTIPFGEN